MQPELRTARLLLRRFRPSDLAAFARFASDEHYRRYLGAEHPDVDTFVARNLAVDGEREYAWVVELDGEVVGSVFLGESAEIACLLDPAHWGRGIGTEATRAVVDFGFKRAGRNEVWGGADPRNVASVRGMLHLGFRRDADGSAFRLRRDEWES